MATKQKALKTYQNQIRERCVKIQGEDWANENEELIEAAARNKRLLDRFDKELDEHELTIVSTGSQGQMKEEVNPIVKYRNDVAKLYADNLEALMLTARSRYKKAENDKGGKEDDPMISFLNKVKK